jgi:hypothetical protein
VTGLTTHGACGATWKQHGNRTGHCGVCHRTFEGSGLFDWHQELQADGSVICRDPSRPEFAKKGLRFLDGTWRGPEWARNVFAEEVAS